MMRAIKLLVRGKWTWKFMPETLCDDAILKVLSEAQKKQAIKKLIKGASDNLCQII